MSQASPAYPTTWKRKPQIFTDPFWRRLIFSGIALYLFLAVGSVDVNWTRVWDGLRKRAAICGGLSGPRFHQPLA